MQQIAPVLLLKSRNETYAENLQSAAIIGEMVGKKREMQARLEQHKERMAQWASQLPKGTRVAFGTSREQQFNLHTQETWTGSVLASLGLNVPAAMAGASMPSIGWSNCWRSILPGCWLPTIAKRALLNAGNKIRSGRC